MFELTEKVLLDLCKLNYFNPPTGEMVFFGLRGCLPFDTDNNSFAASHTMELASPDHISPRCTLGQWLPGGGIAVFVGSTVPHQKNVARAKTKGGSGTNRLMTGYYRDYRKGKHKATSPTGHSAFRQANKLPVRRSAHDLDYDNDDRVEYAMAFDNLHAAWCPGVDHPSFASAGCQVVVGYPACERRGNKPETGAWAAFRQSAYARAQDSFDYILLNGREANKLALSPASASHLPRARYGSKGPVVEQIQNALNAQGFSVGRADGDFGWRTLSSLLEFQEATFGTDADDGVVGPQTAASLGLSWTAV